MSLLEGKLSTYSFRHARGKTVVHVDPPPAVRERTRGVRHGGGIETTFAERVSGRTASRGQTQEPCGVWIGRCSVPRNFKGYRSQDVYRHRHLQHDGIKAATYIYIRGSMEENLVGVLLQSLSCDHR